MKPQETAAFSPKQDRAATLLASGMTARAVAMKIGGGERTIRGWMSDPEFKKLIGTYQAAMVARALARLSGTAARAVLALIGCLKSKEDAIKIRAALGILDQLIRIRDSVEIERRLSELERKVRGKGQS